MFYIHQISSWKKGERKIRHRFFLKPIIHFGSDKTCDWRWGLKSPLMARLDTHTRVLSLLEREEEIALESGGLFELDGQIFSWTTRSPLSFHGLTVAALTGIILLGVFWVHYYPHPENCQQQMSRVFESWSTELKPAREKRKILERSLRARDSSVIQTELFAFEESLKKIPQLKACPVEILSSNYRIKLKEIIFYEETRKSNFERALQVWRELLASSDYTMGLVFKRDVLRVGRDLAWRSWRLETKDPVQAREIQSFLDEICMSLQKDPDCFLPNLQFPPRNKVGPQPANLGEEGRDLSLVQKGQFD